MKWVVKAMIMMDEDEVGLHYQQKAQRRKTYNRLSSSCFYLV